MPTLTFTNHFKNNWQARVGGEPIPATVQHIIHTSVRIQKSFYATVDDKPFRVLAIYWHPELDLIIKLDPIDNCAVTVMSRSCWRYDGQPAAADKPTPAPAIDFARACQESRDVIAMRRQKSREIAARAVRVAEAFAPRKGVAR